MSIFTITQIYEYSFRQLGLTPKIQEMKHEFNHSNP
jgi:hypothetical protein